MLRDPRGKKKGRISTKHCKRDSCVNLSGCTHWLICEPAGDERIPFWNIAWGENPVMLLCEDPLKAPPCKETFFPRVGLTAAVTVSANVVHLHTDKHGHTTKCHRIHRRPGVYKTYWGTYCWTLNELGRAPLLVYRSASFPTSIASSVMSKSWKAFEVNAFAMAIASRNAAVRLFSPKLTPHMTGVPEKR